MGESLKQKTVFKDYNILSLLFSVNYSAEWIRSCVWEWWHPPRSSSFYRILFQPLCLFFKENSLLSLLHPSTPISSAIWQTIPLMLSISLSYSVESLSISLFYNFISLSFSLHGLARLLTHISLSQIACIPGLYGYSNFFDLELQSEIDSGIW